MRSAGLRIVGINRVGLTVADVERATAFYTSVTPLEPIGDGLLRAPNAHLEFSPGAVDTTVPVEGPGVTHVCLQSPAEHSLYRSMLTAGASAVSRDGPVDLNGAGVEYGYARDLDGIMFEVEELERPRFDGPIWLAHVALVSPDLDRLVDFYEQVLGVAPYSRVNKVVGPRFDQVTDIDDVRVRAAWFNAGNMILELWQYVNPATPEPDEIRPTDAVGYDRFVFEVDDLEMHADRLRSLGAPLDDEICEVDGGRLMHGRDPDHNRFALLELPAGSPRSLDRLKRIDWM